MRAALLSTIMLLVGCGPQDAANNEASKPTETAFERHWPGHVATNDEFRIHATFPDDQPVCVSDSGTHIRGFHQWRDGDCDDQTRSSDRFLSVYADYNAAQFSWDEAIRLICGEDTESFNLGMEATSGGRLEACRPRSADADYVVTVLYLADLPDMFLGDEVEGGGPDLIYSIWLGIGSETKEADLATGRAFIGQLQLGGGRFQPVGS